MVAGVMGWRGSLALGKDACRFVGRMSQQHYHCPGWRLRGGWAKEQRG